MRHPDQYNFSSDTHPIQTRTTSSETLPFSISRLLSKPFEANNNTISSDEKLDRENIYAATTHALTSHAYTANGSLFTYPLYATAGHHPVLRVPPRNGGAPVPLQWTLHPAALAHQQAVKDRLAGTKLIVVFRIPKIRVLLRFLPPAAALHLISLIIRLISYCFQRFRLSGRPPR